MCLSSGEGQGWWDKATCAGPASCSHAQGLPTSCTAAEAVPWQERCWGEQRQVWQRQELALLEPMSPTPVLQHRRGCPGLFSPPLTVGFHLSSREFIGLCCHPGLLKTSVLVFFFAFFIPWEEQSLVKGQNLRNKHISQGSACPQVAPGAGLGGGTCTGTSSWWHRTSGTSSPGLMGNPIGLQLRKGRRGVRCP